MPRDLSRRDEGSLLLFTLLILLSGASLLFLAKTRDGIPRNAVNVNSANARVLARVFEIDSGRARTLVQARERLGGFRYARQIEEVRLFSDRDVLRFAQSLEETKLDLNEASARELERRLGVSRG